MRKKSGLKTLLLAKIGRKFTDFLKESSNFCSIPQSFSLKNVHYFKSHNLPIHFHASSKEKTFKKGHLLPIYGITYFSHFFRTFAKNCTFLSFFAKKVRCEKCRGLLVYVRCAQRFGIILVRITWAKTCCALLFQMCFISHSRLTGCDCNNDCCKTGAAPKKEQKKEKPPSPAVCKANNGKKCMMKKDLPWWAGPYYMKNTGDPCFLFGRYRRRVQICSIFFYYSTCNLI